MATDKQYWHRYTGFYEQNVFSKLKRQANILELGILHGDSIRLLRERFPNASIKGVDITSSEDLWPVDKRIKYYRVDPFAEDYMKRFYEELNQSFALIIDDASHDPVDQITNLMEAYSSLNRGAYYI